MGQFEVSSEIHLFFIRLTTSLKTLGSIIDIIDIIDIRYKKKTAWHTTLFTTSLHAFYVIFLFMFVILARNIFSYDNQCPVNTHIWYMIVNLYLNDIREKVNKRIEITNKMLLWTENTLSIKIIYFDSKCKIYKTLVMQY